MEIYGLYDLLEKYDASVSNLDKYVYSNKFLDIEKIEIDTFRNIPDIYKTYKVCMQEVKRIGKSFKYIPSKLDTFELCYEAFNKDIAVQDYIPLRFLNFKMYFKTIKNNYYRILYLPLKFDKIKFIQKIVKEVIDEDFIDYYFWWDYEFEDLQDKTKKEKSFKINISYYTF
jgi:hypothetical protein